ncbi:uncharacterized protein [Primulina huaijiensis]|uniref:uncharacterized protein n=1 Tax=Primulina huaijiensis TaxID=1492673 RepID=UPI003CC76037
MKASNVEMSPEEFRLHSRLTLNDIAGTPGVAMKSATWTQDRRKPVKFKVPVAAEVCKSKEIYDEKKLVGMTTLDMVRAKTFLGQAKVNVAGVEELFVLSFYCY